MSDLTSCYLVCECGHWRPYEQITCDQCAEIERLTEERDMAYESLRIIRTWAKCWDELFEPHGKAMQDIVSMSDKGLGKNAQPAEDNT